MFVFFVAILFVFVAAFAFVSVHFAAFIFIVEAKKKLPNQMKIGQQMTYSTSQLVDKRYVAMLWLCEFYPGGHTDNIVK
jgi:hypothetical protein